LERRGRRRRGDGQTDCTAVFQKLLDAAGNAGAGVEVPRPLPPQWPPFHPANVTLQGIHRVPPTSAATVITNLTGSVLFAYAGRGLTNDPPFIRLAGRHAVVAGW